MKQIRNRPDEYVTRAMLARGKSLKDIVSERAGDYPAHLAWLAYSKPELKCYDAPQDFWAVTPYSSQELVSEFQALLQRQQSDEGLIEELAVALAGNVIVYELISQNRDYVETPSKSLVNISNALAANNVILDKANTRLKEGRNEKI